ncbi:MAG: glycerol-3-phosphate 1-O-acyltransferase PlsY, partial [Calditrichota bacterium]
CILSDTNVASNVPFDCTLVLVGRSSMRLLLLLLGAVLMGGFPTGTFLSRYFLKSDIRRLGSGNPGAMNVWRVFGYKYGLIVIFVDVLKAWLAVRVLPDVMEVEIDYSTRALVGLLVVAGHIWSPWTHFRGGKGVGAAFGAGLALYPIAALICGAVWGATLAITRYSSVAGMTAAVCYPAVVYWRCQPDLKETWICLSLPLLMLYTHRANLKRLRLGREFKMWGSS